MNPVIVKLTNLDGSPLYLNLLFLESMFSTKRLGKGTVTEIYPSGSGPDDGYMVRETPEQIMQAVHEYVYVVEVAVDVTDQSREEGTTEATPGGAAGEHS
jgi:hypothetical protein